MYLVLNEKVYQRHKSSEEAASEDFSVLESSGVLGAESNTAQGPRKGRDKV
jgi:hypothetical protein